MRTSILIDEKLIKKALTLGGFKTKREAVEKSLKLFIQLKEQEKIKNYRGKLKWEGDLENIRNDQ